MPNAEDHLRVMVGDLIMKVAIQAAEIDSLKAQLVDALKRTTEPADPAIRNEEY